MFRSTGDSSVYNTVILLAILALSGLILFTPDHPYSLRAPQKNPFPTSLTQKLEIPEFEDRTLAMGLTFSHRQGEEHLKGLDETLAPGACAFDYDNDGWVDLFLVNGSGQTRYYGKPHWWQRGEGNALFRNLGGRGFIETTDTAGLRVSMWATGCVIADFDNDGDQDLWVTTRSGNSIYRNNGDGQFSNVTAASGIRDSDWSTTATVADYDGDGLLDIYVAHYVNFNKSAHTFEAGTQFAENTAGQFSEQLYEPSGNRLYRNLGNLRFRDMTEWAGVANREGRSLGAAWFDADGDRRPDLLVSNDRGVASNTVFLNRGAQGFTPAGLHYGLNSSAGHRGIALGDINGDGAQDLVLASNREQPLLTMLRQTDGQPQFYVDHARELGIAKETSNHLEAWTPGLHDFNNDGGLDLFMANGSTLPDQDAQRVPLGQSKQLWLNRNGHSFEDVSNRAGIALQDTQSARGAAFADFDNDGDIDIYIAHNNDLGQLLINISPPNHHWLGVHLSAGEKNRDAIGARIIVRNGTNEQHRVIVAGNGFASDSDRRAHFGLGTASKVDSLRVEWPDGSVEEYRDSAIDRYVLVRQGAGQVETETHTRFAANSNVSYFGADDPINFRRYLRLLVQVAGIEEALPELRLALGTTEPKTRNTVIKLLAKHKSSRGIALLVDALEDSDAGVVISAIQALCGYEDETSARWLLRTFHHPAPEVRKALAECFAYFFREEEAVIHRKYLALPYLIDLLDDPVQDVRIAAIRALGDAERYRAVVPLLGVLETTQGQTQAESARALGLIRERKALPGLMKVLAKVDSPPMVRAQTLIALKRLGYPAFDRLLEDFFEGREKFMELPLMVRLETAKEILADEDDGIVLNRREWFSHLLAWVGRIPEQSMGKAEAQTLAEVLSIYGLPDALTLLERLAVHPEPSVRKTARVALLRIDLPHRSQHAEIGLKDDTPEVRLELLKALAQKGFSGKISSSLLLDNANRLETRNAALKVLYLGRDNPLKIADYLGAVLRDSSQSDEAKISALVSVAALEQATPSWPEDWYRAANPELRIAALTAWLARHGEYLPVPDLPAPFTATLGDPDAQVRQEAARLLSLRPEAWAQRALELRLEDDEAYLPLRKELLRHYKTTNRESARRILLKIAQDSRDPLRYRAIRKLADLGDPSLDSQAWSWLKNASEPLKIRILAAKMLAPRYGISVVEELRSREAN
jgi:HEAT repeat protein